MTHHLDWLDDSECVEDMLGHELPEGVAIAQYLGDAFRTRLAALRGRYVFAYRRYRGAIAIAIVTVCTLYALKLDVIG